MDGEINEDKLNSSRKNYAYPRTEYELKSGVRVLYPTGYYMTKNRLEKYDSIVDNFEQIYGRKVWRIFVNKDVTKISEEIDHIKIVFVDNKKLGNTYLDTLSKSELKSKLKQLRDQQN